MKHNCKFKRNTFNNCIQSIPPHPTSWRSILILSSHLSLRLPSITKDSNQILIMKPNCKSNRNSFNNCIQSIPPHPTSWRSSLILSSQLSLRLPSITKDSNQISMMKTNYKFNWNTFNNFRGKNMSASTREGSWLLSLQSVVWILTSLWNSEHFSLTGFAWRFWQQFHE